MTEEKLLKSALREAGEPFRRNGVEFRRCLLGFEWKGELGFVASVQRPFQPRGLAIWGAPPGAVVQQALVGNDLQLVASFGDVPARFFAMGDSYEQIAKLLDQGKEPPAWCDWDVAHPGMFIRVRLCASGKSQVALYEGIELAMWGVACA